MKAERVILWEKGDVVENHPFIDREDTTAKLQIYNQFGVYKFHLQIKNSILPLSMSFDTKSYILTKEE